jgi:hypothetical protein
MPVEFTRANDLPKASERAAGGTTINPSLLVGVWHSTNRETRGIIRLVLLEQQGALTLQAFGAAESSEIDWGTVQGQAFAVDVDGVEGVAFRAFYDFGFLQTVVAAYLNNRILVVDTYNTFKDGSARSDYFLRDHFYQ